MAEKAEEINPQIFWPSILAYRWTGRLEESIAIAQRIPIANSFYSVYIRHLYLAILYSELGRFEEARTEASKLLKLAPGFSVDVWGERVPYKNPSQAERDMAALRKAGLK